MTPFEIAGELLETVKGLIDAWEHCSKTDKNGDIPWHERAIIRKHINQLRTFIDQWEKSLLDGQGYSHHIRAELASLRRVIEWFLSADPSSADLCSDTIRMSASILSECLKLAVEECATYARRNVQ